MGGSYTSNPYGGGNSYSSNPYGGSGQVVPKPKPSGGGGVGGFLGHLGSDAVSGIEGLPTGVEKVASSIASDVTHPSHLLNYGKAALLGLSGDPLGAVQAAKQTSVGKNVVAPIAQSYSNTYSPLLHGHVGQFAHEVDQHPLGPILDALTVATLGAGGAAKVGETLAKAGVISDASRLANLGKAADLTVPDFGGGENILIKQTSANPLVRARQVGVNNALNALPSETPLLGSTARGVRALSRLSAKEGARLDVQAGDFANAFAKLTKDEKAAWHLRARGLTPQSYSDMLTSGGENVSPAMVKTLANPKLADLVANPTPNLRAALDTGRALSDRLTGLRVAAGHIDEQTALEAPYRHLRLAGGAKVESVPAPSVALKGATAERDRIAALYDSALAKEQDWMGKQQGDIARLTATEPGFTVRNIPMTEDAAQARLAELDRQHQALVQKLVPEVSPYGGKLSQAEQLRRNFENSRAGRGNRIGADRMPTVKSEEYRLAEDKLRQIAESNAGNPVADRINQLLAERDQLRNLVNSRAEAAFSRETPPALPTAETRVETGDVPKVVGGPSLGLDNPHREQINNLGHALEVAQQRVDRLAGSTMRTNTVRLVGGPSIEDLMRQIDEAGGEQPFHVKDLATVKNGPLPRWMSKPSGFSAPASGVKQSQMVLARQGRINLGENALLRDYHAFRNQAQAQLLHDELVKHAAIVGRDEQIPAGWEELKLNRGQPSASYTQRIAAPLEHELNPPSLLERLREAGQPGALPAASPEQPFRLVVPAQVRRLVEDESKTYASRLSALRNVPLSAWKMLVLGLRPAFFANITVGNTVLGMLQMAPGRWGFVGWLNQVVPGFEKLAGPRLSGETMREVFPEQAGGTFAGSVSHRMYHGSNRVLHGAETMLQGVTPATIGYENVLRRSLVEGWARSTPQVQKLMERNGGDINAALREVAQASPQTVDAISRRVDNALGNYRTYNRFERGLKAVVPFYGWNRHITSSLFRLASERPQVLDALLNTGTVGKQKADQILGALPSYLGGSVAAHLPSWLGGQQGATTILDPTSWNPFSTVIDEGRLLANLAGGKAGAASDAYPLAPDVSALIEQMTGRSLLTGAPIKGNAFADEAKNLSPQVSLFTRGKPRPTAINQNQRLAQLMRLLGLPVENLNLAAAHAAAAKGR